MSAEILKINPEDIRFLDRMITDANGRLIPFTAEFYQKHIHLVNLRAWCHEKARYCVITRELIDWLLEQICGKTALEIGAGMGDLGYRLGITMSDSYQQVYDDATRFVMDAFKQPPTKPPADVIQIDAQSAVLKYKPQVVIGAWITERWLPGRDEGNIHGPREEQIIKNCETYIFIGNENIHGRKRILALPHETYRFPWLVSRAADQSKNAIYVWHK